MLIVGTTERGTKIVLVSVILFVLLRFDEVCFTMIK